MVSPAEPTSGPRRPPPLERFTPTSGLFAGWAGVALAGFTVVYVVLAVHTVTGLRMGLGALFFGLVVWVTQLRPRATAYADHVLLKNSVRDAVVPLTAVDDIVMGQTLQVWVGERRYTCIGIGASLRESVASRRRRDRTTDSGRFSDLAARADRAGSDEYAVSYPGFVLTRLTELVESAKRGQHVMPDPPLVSTPGHRVAWPEVVALVLSGATFVVSLLL